MKKNTGMMVESILMSMLLVGIGFIACFVIIDISGLRNRERPEAIVRPAVNPIVVASPVQPVPEPRGRYVRGYLWSGRRGERVAGIFSDLWARGFRFGAVAASGYNSALVRFSERIDEKYPMLVELGRLKRDLTIDFGLSRRGGVSPATFSPDGGQWVKVRAKITHYCWHHPGEIKVGKGRTSTGRSAKNSSGVAVDPRMIPYGSEVYVPGYGLRVADDTGGIPRRYGQQGRYLVDIRHESISVRRARELGTMWTNVWVKR